MKRIISAIVAASLTLACTVLPASAQGRMASMMNAFSDMSEIHIVYNDTVVPYEDVKPINTDGRVMIPFRAALESMGATVDYDAASRVITASKGDTTITFSQDSDIINIDKNGEKSTITMDVPIINVSDRIMVPIRFMSNALGMQVGWSGDRNTVVIADYSELADNLKAIAPNLVKLAEAKTPDVNKSNGSFDVALNIEGAANGASSVNVSGSMDSLTSGTKESGSAEISVKSEKVSLDKVKVDLVFDSGKIYIKTDALDKVSEALDIAELQTAAALVNADTWYSIDIVKLYETIGVDESLTAMLKNAVTSTNKDILNTIIMSGVTTDQDAKLDDIIKVSMLLDVVEAMDKYIDVQNADGGMKVTINMTTKDLMDIANAVMGDMLTEEDKSMIEQMLSLTLNATVTLSENESSTDVDFALGVNVGTEKLELTMKVNEKSVASQDGEEVTVPTESTDITDFLCTALNTGNAE